LIDLTRERLDISRRVNFQPLENKSILITGATGFVGSWLGEGLRAANYQGVKYSTFPLDHAGFKIWMNGNFKQHYDYIIHLAPPFGPKIEERFQQCTPDTLFFASSGGVYHKEMNRYDIGKHHAENDFIRMGFPVKIARMFTCCGAYLRPDNFAIGNFVKNACKNKKYNKEEPLPINVFGDGSTIRTYMYGADLSVWLWNIILYGKEKQIYNVGSEQQITMIDLANKVRDIVNPTSVVQFTKPDFWERAPVYVPDTSLTRAELNVAETYDLDYQITKYAEWVYETL
jgi:nucleoside-diphosphate-sugar epimerase